MKKKYLLLVSVLILTLCAMNQFANAQCPGNKVLMTNFGYIDSHLKTCTTPCRTKCVLPSQVEKYQNQGWTLRPCLYCTSSLREGSGAIQEETSLTGKLIQIPIFDATHAPAIQPHSAISGENEFEESLKKGNRTSGNLNRGANIHSAENYNAERVSSCTPPPIVQTNFEGNRGVTYCKLPTPPNCAPSECSIAISNAGKIVSVSNSWMNYYDQNGTMTFSDTLYHFGQGVVDGRVLYDPKADRFIYSALWILYDLIHDDPIQKKGTVIGFSKTNNPAGGWNIYQIPYTDFNDNSESDYPLIATSDSELFVSVSYYASNFKHGEIMQMDKNAGYAGAALINTVKYDAPLSGSVKGSLIPAQGGSTTYGPNMFFMMADETGNISNKYVLYEVTNTIASGSATLNRYGPFNTNLPYRGSGVSLQPGGLEAFVWGSGDKIENAFYENGIIQFCQKSQTNGKASPYVGRVTGIPNNLSCTAKAVSSPNLYLSFPSIVYAGNSSTDNSAIVGIQHSGANTFPGLSAVYVNNNFDISELVTVKNGNDTLNYIWGDYSGICKRYNHPGEVWFEGQYGSLTPNKANWIAKLQKPAACQEQIIVSKKLESEKLNTSLSIFPNPFSNTSTILFTLSQSQKVSIKIFDMEGRLLKTLADKEMSEGYHQLTWNVENVKAGIYFLRMKTENYSETKKLVVIK